MLRWRGMEFIRSFGGESSWKTEK